jgi:hypothetical protein
VEKIYYCCYHVCFLIGQGAPFRMNLCPFSSVLMCEHLFTALFDMITFSNCLKPRYVKHENSLLNFLRYKESVIIIVNVTQTSMQQTRVDSYAFDEKWKPDETVANRWICK